MKIKKRLVMAASFGLVALFAAGLARAEPPETPTPISPNGTIDTNTPTYVWNAVEDGVNYYIELYDDSTDTKITRVLYTAQEVGCPGGTGECSGVIPEEWAGGVLADGAYGWQVQAENDDDQRSFISARMSFTVDTSNVPPGPATLIDPCCNRTYSDNTPTYKWYAVENTTDYYLLVLNSASTPVEYGWHTAGEANCGDGTGECSLTPAAELADGAYVWLIKTANDYGDGPWSDPSRSTFTVSTGPNDPPGQATLISPSGEIEDNTPEYVWNALENATEYTLYLYDSEENLITQLRYTAGEANCDDGTGECSVVLPEGQPGGLLADGSYQWQIKTRNDFGDGPLSTELSFTVVAGTFAYVSTFEGCGGNDPCYQSIQDALNNEDSGKEIRITAEDYDEAASLSASKNLTLSGGWNSDYSDQSGQTTANSLTISDGSIVTEFIVINGP